MRDNRRILLISACLVLVAYMIMLLLFGAHFILVVNNHGIYSSMPRYFI